MDVQMMHSDKVILGMTVAMMTGGEYTDTFVVNDKVTERGTVRLFDGRGVGYVYWLDAVPVCWVACWACETPYLDPTGHDDNCPNNSIAARIGGLID
ncbi:hypothetical protein [Longispora urticae]